MKHKEKQIAAPKNKYPPIYSTDGVKIEIGALLFQPKFSVRDFKNRADAYWDDDDIPEDERTPLLITPLRVTTVDLVRRTIRVRCARGCEEVISFDSSCDMAGYYIKKENAEEWLNDKRSIYTSDELRTAQVHTRRISVANTCPIECGGIPPEHTPESEDV